MHPLSGPLFVALVVLTLGGVLKIVRPDDTANAMRAMGLPSHRALVRSMGGAEVALGLSTLVWAMPILAFAVAVAYVAFAGFVLLALRRGLSIQSCGCFGRVDTPPSAAHLAVNLSAAATAVGWAVTADRSFVSQLGDHLAEGIPLLVLSLVGVYLVYVALTAFPETMAEVRRRAT